ncbi:Mg2+ and Co2+ transporter CorA [Planomicrobium koreense]|uniref:Mg2+ and Co2+ transporter CorA n=1 Tax=Planococcus koreensis TaxID=112331 RepID=A0A7W8CVV8_9BACL|nr:magnesium transporter CorA family protein [Planococcus koreensis]MBB5181428.1 Mg2+ and Co2+ transporter CorA [Planococcus koreensis]
MPQYKFMHVAWQEEGSIGDEDFLKFLPDHYKMHSWIKDSQDLEVNILHNDTVEPGGEGIWGSLIYRQSQHDKNELDVFHFYLSRDILVTNELDFDKDADLDKDTLLKQMEGAATTVELMMVFLGHMVSSILHKIDKFEERLRNLLWEISENNESKTLDKIADLRHEILLWKHLIQGFAEIQMAIPETFGPDVRDGIEFYRTSQRIERCVILVDSYQDEIKNMVDMENVVANYRGNEIIKTLTVLTTLFTPAMAWGAIWGMNFKHMPELYWTFGYLVSLVIIIFSTGALYLFFKRRGWTGDILKAKHPDLEKAKKSGE